MPLKNGRTSASLQTIVVGSVIPPGTIQAFGGGAIPEGWLLCDGSAVSRSVYANLFATISTSHGQGDGSTTFNLPDYQGMFLRGRVAVSNSIAGSGTASSNQATFTSHGIKRTGFKVRVASGTLTGLTIGVDYFAIVVDSNTLAFATSLSNAIANNRVTVLGINSAILTQFEDPEAASRAAASPGGSTGLAVGSIQQDAMQGHRHTVYAADNASGTTWPTGSGTNTNRPNTSSDPTSDGTNGSPRISSETRPKNISVNYIIKF